MMTLTTTTTITTTTDTVITGCTFTGPVEFRTTNGGVTVTGCTFHCGEKPIPRWYDLVGWARYIHSLRNPPPMVSAHPQHAVASLGLSKDQEIADLKAELAQYKALVE